MIVTNQLSKKINWLQIKQLLRLIGIIDWDDWLGLLIGMIDWDDWLGWLIGMIDCDDWLGWLIGMIDQYN